MIRLICALLLLAIAPIANGQVPAAAPWHGKERTLHYRPEGKDFVTTNGALRFNRALYGGNTAFRVEAGDLPEFALYLPGMGGNCKLGIISGNKSSWLTAAKNIKAIYRPGSMQYEIRDPLLGTGSLLLNVIATYDQEAMIIQVVPKGLTVPVQLLAAFGGATGKKFSRDGDIGADPESSFYLQPAYCTGNAYELQGNQFTVRFGDNGAKKLEGVFPAGMQLHTADANQQQSPLSADASTAGNAPMVCGKVELKRTDTAYFLIRQPAANAGAVAYTDIPAIYRSADSARGLLANRIKINTPDPYLNTLGGALGIAADAIWDDPTYMHGAIAWRMRLPAWRGAYTADPLGWHDRARRHFTSYAASQVTTPLSGPVVPDTALHFARQQEKMGNAMFSSGYICRNPNGDMRPHHYDMNLVFIDQLLTHCSYTGDTAFIREIWPVIERHLSWEKRNFDADNDGLYDAYCCIWASDALQYSGGGVTHSSAYNYRANAMAATLAAIVGKDGKPYREEAAKIAAAINKQLWLPSAGVYGEYKDLLGLQLVHPSAGLWTIYHALDGGLPNAFQAWQSLKYIDQHLPHIPMQVKGLPGKDHYMLSTTNWQPYTWSINNVALAENLHTALAYWQGNRADEAFRLWKSALLESMYVGASPGNFQQLPFYDAIRGELYRDFADPIGMASRTLVEGLFGILPDAIRDTLTIRPGWPAGWNAASLQTPGIQVDYKRDAVKDQYIIVPGYSHTMHLRLVVRAVKTGVPVVTVNGKPVAGRPVNEAVGEPLWEITVPKQNKYAISITWKGAVPQALQVDSSQVGGTAIAINGGNAAVQQVYDPQGALQLPLVRNNKVEGRVAMGEGGKTFFVQLKQGSMSWWQAVDINITQSLDIIPVRQDSTGIYFKVRNHIQAVKGRLVLNPGPRLISMPLEVPAKGVSPTVHIPAPYLVSGTNIIRFVWDSTRVVEATMLNWSIPSIGIAFEKIELANKMNGKLNKVFEPVYLSPRPASPTLQLPTQGIGNWCYPLVQPVINDSGLRQLAGSNNEINLEQHIPFGTSGDTSANNVLWTSQWDNYPDSTVLPLTGRSSHAYLLMAGTTNPMQSRMANGRVVVEYTDGTADTLLLKNPENWWPIEQDFYTDGYAFTTDAEEPLRLYLKTGVVVAPSSVKEYTSLKGFSNRAIDGGAATILDMPLNSEKELKSLTVHALANDVLIGLLSVTLVRN
ncbi:DUF4450 domain-containing protein [Paraflavitalea sp. CAU 1676]|uniref:DUF4450 domain-containing protein n=1 Tax=Paraflavitalea sp. CAU 1676 TaxID=3032598 RepID=UPI0023D9C171|nr:DUF4450 domain-containing protein [Paraflavitalea sp. CAU 1676]MDF2192879.1 DUF4450 domain-containing protein [Paraflavitalea sp. CAU 1676]